VRALAAFLAFASISAAVPRQQARFRSTSSLVRLDVSVTDDRGNVRGLNASDFTVTDGGRLQIVHVDESADAPLDLELVAQPTASLAYTSREQAARMGLGLSAFLGQVESRDRFGAILAGAPPTRVQALAFGRPIFDSRTFADGTHAAPFDAMAAALSEFPESDRRKALIVFCNGADFRSTISFDALADAAGHLGPAFVLIASPVIVDHDVHVGARTREGIPLAQATAKVSGWQFPAVLEKLAKKTGGFTLNLGDGDPNTLIADLLARLRTQYVITYEPPGAKGWHPVSVRVNRRGVRVITREGYFVD
jgi:hypothetical protein